MSKSIMINHFSFQWLGMCTWLNPAIETWQKLVGSCWKSLMDREAWRAVIYGVAKSQTRLSDWTELKKKSQERKKKQFLTLLWKLLDLDRKLEIFETILWIQGASIMAQMVKNLPAMQETWIQSLGWEDLLEKGTATHSSILAWRIPWTEKPGELQS